MALFSLTGCGGGGGGGSSGSDDLPVVDPVVVAMNEADFGVGAEVQTQDMGAGDDLHIYFNGIKSKAGNYVINLSGSHNFTGSITLKSDVNISLRGTGTINVGSADRLFSIDGAKLIIRGVTLKGKAGTAYSLLTVSGGSLVLHTGKITGHTNTMGGGGVYVGANSTFTMLGGTIIGNSSSDGNGGGVAVGNSGSFTKTGGIIYGKDAATASDKNSASADNKGHAVYVNSNGKYRDTTAGESVNLNTTNGVGWE